MKRLLFLLALIPVFAFGQTTINLSPDSTKYDLHILSGGWSPASIPNLEFWYDAMDESTVSLSGSDVTGFEDKSSYGRDLAVGTNSPSYSAVTHRITFDKTNTENLRYATGFVLSQPHTTIVVYKKLVSKDIVEYLIGSITSTPYGGLIGTSTSGLGAFAANSGTALNAVANDYLDHIHVVIFNTTTSYYLDDAAPVTGSAGTNNFTGIELGSYNNGAVYGNFEFMEAIGYSGAISDENRALLSAYLQDKWGL